MRKLLLLLLLIMASVTNAQTLSHHFRKNVSKPKAYSSDYDFFKAEIKKSEKKKANPFGTSLPDYGILIQDDSETELEKYLIYYDDEGRLISDTYTKELDESTIEEIYNWKSYPDYRTIVQYDSEERITYQANYEWDDKKDELILTYKEITTFHNGENAKVKEVYDYYSENSLDAYKIENNYNDEGYMIGAYLYSLDENDEDWILQEEMRAEYTIESDGKIAYTLYYRDIEDEEETEFWLEGKEIYEYDNKNRIIYLESQIWDEDENIFIPGVKYVAAYNSADKKLFEEYYLYNPLADRWIFIEAEKHFYNDKNNITLTEFYTIYYNNGIDSYTHIVYHYDGGVGMCKNITSDKNISFTKGTLTITTPDTETIHMISIEGKEVKSLHKDAGESYFTITNVTPGIYILKGSTGWTHKIVVNP